MSPLWNGHFLVITKMEMGARRRERANYAISPPPHMENLLHRGGDVNRGIPPPVEVDG